MAHLCSTHPTHPSARLLQNTAEALRRGGVIALPTDCCYVLACAFDNKDAAEQIRRIRGVDERHHLTLICPTLSSIAQFARVDNAQYRWLKACTPGSYTFILEGSKELPRRLLHPKRKTLGLRIPAHPLCLALLEQLQEPLLSASLILPGDEFALTEAWEIQDSLDNQLALILDAGQCGGAPTTIIDLSDGTPKLIRQGKGALAPLGLA
ncbi:MAG: L-threonylcarbamoyladenylate synthase [Pseudomonadota bacterium]